MHVHCQFYCDWHERARELIRQSVSQPVRALGYAHLHRRWRCWHLQEISTIVSREREASCWPEEPGKDVMTVMSGVQVSRTRTWSWYCRHGHGLGIMNGGRNRKTAELAEPRAYHWELGRNTPGNTSRYLETLAMIIRNIHSLIWNTRNDPEVFFSSWAQAERA